MELRQLEYLVAVAEEGSFTRAAERVHVAQPGVSAQIRRLEHELGEELLDRSAHGVRVTDAGAAVLPHARAALDALAAARHAVDELTGLVHGRVAVGMVVACSSLDVTELLAAFHREHPGVDITLTEADSADLLDAVRAATIDLAFVGLAGSPPPGIALHVVADEALVATVTHDDPLASRDGITLRALGDRPLVTLPRGTGLRAALDRACASAGFRPRIAFEASNLAIVAELGRRGLGVAMLPESLAAAQARHLHALTITAPRIRGRLALAWRADGARRPAARALVARARELVPAAAAPVPPVTKPRRRARSL